MLYINDINLLNIMVTRFKDGNKNIRIVTQQYEVGLYIAVYDNDSGDFLTQGCVDITEEEYHKRLREKYKDNLIN